MTELEKWEQDAVECGWVMPTAPWWKRLWGVRHVRAFALAIAVDRHNRFFRSMGLVPTGYDSWVIYGIAMGKERSNA